MFAQLYQRSILVSDLVLDLPNGLRLPQPGLADLESGLPVLSPPLRKPHWHGNSKSEFEIIAEGLDPGMQRCRIAFGQQVIFQVNLWQKVLELQLSVHLQAPEFIIEDLEFGVFPQGGFQGADEFRRHPGGETGHHGQGVRPNARRKIPGLLIGLPEKVGQFQTSLGQVEGGFIQGQLEGLQLCQGFRGIDGRSIPLLMTGSHQSKALTTHFHRVGQQALDLIGLYPVPVTFGRLMQ